MEQNQNMQYPNAIHFSAPVFIRTPHPPYAFRRFFASRFPVKPYMSIG
jgi:hypothetical protein